MFEATGGQDWVNNHNWLSDKQLSAWYGVTTDESGRVTRLSLRGNQLNGEIPAQLGALSELERLVIDDNQLSGEIPVELGNLSNLQWLDLDRNLLSGPIPSALGGLAVLERLDLFGQPVERANSS